MLIRRWWFIIAAALVGIVGLYLHFAWQTPADLERKGPKEIQEWVALATSIVGFFAALVGLIAKVRELRTAK